MFLLDSRALCLVVTSQLRHASGGTTSAGTGRQLDDAKQLFCAMSIVASNAAQRSRGGSAARAIQQAKEQTAALQEELPGPYYHSQAAERTPPASVAGAGTESEGPRLWQGEKTLLERAAAKLKKDLTGTPRSAVQPADDKAGSGSSTDANAVRAHGGTHSGADAEANTVKHEAGGLGVAVEEEDPEPAVFEQVRAMMADMETGGGEEGADGEGMDPVQRMLDVLKAHLRDEAEELREANDEGEHKLGTPWYDLERRTRAWSHDSSRDFSSRLGAMEAKVTASLDQDVEGLKRGMDQHSHRVAPRTPRGATNVGQMKSGAVVRSSDLPLHRRLADARAATDTLEQRWRNQAAWSRAAWCLSPNGSPTITMGQASRLSESPRVPRSEIARRARSGHATPPPGSPGWRAASSALSPAGIPSHATSDKRVIRPTVGTPSRGR